MNPKKKSVKKRINETVKTDILSANDKSSRKIPWAILLSAISIIVAIIGVTGSYWYNYKNYSKQYGEDVRISIFRNFYDDYNTRIIATEGKEYIFVDFNCELVNNSEKPILITNFESLSFDSLRSNYAIFPDTGNVTMIKFPVKVESKESKHFIIQEMMIMDTSAYALLKSVSLDLSNIPMKMVCQILLKKQIDIFGCKLQIQRLKNGETMVGYNSQALYEKESFTATFETTNQKFSSKYSYYLDNNPKW